jgi:hypothetical protein
MANEVDRRDFLKAGVVAAFVAGCGGLEEKADDSGARPVSENVAWNQWLEKRKTYHPKVRELIDRLYTVARPDGTTVYAKLEYEKGDLNGQISAGLPTKEGSSSQEAYQAPHGNICVRVWDTNKGQYAYPVESIDFSFRTGHATDFVRGEDGKLTEVNGDEKFIGIITDALDHRLGYAEGLERNNPSMGEKDDR